MIENDPAHKITDRPHGHWKTLTFIAALRHDRIDAPWVINGPPGGGMGGMNF